MSDIKISQMEPWVGAVTGNVEFPAVFGNENYRIALNQLTTSTFGFGSMALQNSNSVSITGGNIAVSALSGAITIANGGTGLGTAPGAGQLLIGTGTQYSLSTLTAGTGIAITNAAGAITIAATGAGLGTVTSVDVSGGSTGLTFSGGPVTTSGMITAGGTLAVANGGTGGATASAARANLDAAKSGANSDITSLSGLTTPLSIAQGGTGSVGSLSGYIFGNGMSPFTSVATIPMTDLSGILPIAKGGTGGGNLTDARANLLPAYLGNQGRILAVNSAENNIEWTSVGAGTVTSVAVSGGSTGLTATGSPITSTGTITLGGTLVSTNGGTGQTSYTNGQLLIGKTDGALAKGTLTAGTGITVSNGDGSITVANSAPDQTVVLTGGTGISTSGTYPSFTITNSAPDQVVSLSAGTGISVSGSYPSFTVTNAAPDQVVSLTGAGTTSISGSYPSFTITSNDQFVGTVTSVAASGGTTGLTFSGSPITTSGTLTLSGTLAVANGGTGATNAGTARSNLSAAASGANTDITSIALTSGTITTAPVSGTDIVNKTYADSIASGINFHQSVRLATAAALPANTYNNGSSGVGATLTGNANGALSVDGVTVVAGNRILVKNEATGANNGVYVVTQVGNGSTPYILTRATDFDSAGTGVDQIDEGDFFLVIAGSTQANTSWVQQTPLPITVGTTAIVFTQFAAPITYSAGTGLTLGGTVFSITNTGVSASTYGSASSVPVLAINAQGQVTSASNSSIAIAGSQITSGSVAIAQGGTGATTAATARTNLGSTTVGDALFIAASASAARTTLGATTVGDNFFTLTNPSAITFPRVNADNTVSALSASDFRTAIGAGTGSGTVTSVALSVPAFLSVSGSPVTSSGTLAVSYSGTALPVANGGTGQTSYTDGQLLIGNTTGNTLAKATLTAGTGISITNGAGSITISSTLAGGTVTSVAASGGTTGLNFSGSPITSSGTLTLGGTLAVANGGTGATTESGARTNLGATTVGSNLFTLTNPSAIRFLRVNADNTVSALSDTDFRTAIGAGTGNGTVTSVGGTGTVNGITLTGTVTSSGNLTLGGTLSGVDLATQTTGTLAVGRGGTGATTLTGVVKGNGTSAFTAGTVSLTTEVAGTLPIANGGTNATATPTAGGAAYGTGTAYAFTAAGTAGQVLVSNGTSAPSFKAIDGGTF